MIEPKEQGGLNMPDFQIIDEALKVVWVRRLKMIKLSCNSTFYLISVIAKQESIQLSVSRHSDELKEIFEAIPNNDTEVLNRSREVLFTAYSIQMHSV